MALLQSVVDQAAGWVAFVVVLFVPGVVATVLWTPFLAAKRLRSLFTALPPSGALVSTYVLVGIGASVPYVAGFVAVLVFVDSSGVARSTAFLNVALLLSALYVVGIPVVGVLGLPRVGIEWDPTGYGRSTWVLLVVGSVWYVTLFVVPLAALSIVFALPGGY